MSPRALPGYLLLLSRATTAGRQAEDMLIPSGLGPDWLGRQDHTVLVSSLSLSLKVSLASSSGEVSPGCHVHSTQGPQAMLGSQATE